MDVSEICFACKKTSDQMLMLSCIHDLCINCAALAFAQQVHLKGNSPGDFICEVCGQDTQLDATTVSQLANLAKSFLKIPKSAKTQQHHAPHNTHNPTKTRNYGNSTSPSAKKKQSSTPTGKKTTYYCKQHSEQEISYYCFGCQMNICPECAIHGKHKDHEVKLMKKALGQVKGDYLQIMNLISGSQNSMSKYKDNFLKLIKDSNDKNVKDKALVAKEFENLRTSLAIKQKELIKNIDELNKQNAQMLTGFLEVINIHYEEINKVKKSIELILRKDQVLIFEQYKKVGQFEQKVKLLKKKSDEINGEMVFLDVESWQDIIKNVNRVICDIKQVVKRDQIGAAEYKSSRAKLSQSRNQT